VVASSSTVCPWNEQLQLSGMRGLVTTGSRSLFERIDLVRIAVVPLVVEV
jgi:hypothetical protein